MNLFVETSWESGSLALAKDNQLYSTDWKKRSSHSEVITLKFQELLTMAEGQPSDISKIVLNIGPGSFTGVRVGITFATALAYVHKLPIVTVNSLEIMAFKSESKESLLVALPAIKEHFYVAGFERAGNKISEKLAPRSLSQVETTNLKNKFSRFIDGAQLETRPTASDISRFFRLEARKFEEVLWNFVKPLYLRRSEAEEKLRAGLLKPIYSESEHQVEPNRKK